MPFRDGSPTRSRTSTRRRDYERRLVTHRDELAHHRSGPPLDVVTRDVCEVCNNGWLEKLETEARPVLTPMIRGTARVLSALEQFVVASWATKTMLTMQGTNIGKERVVSAEQYRWFFEHQQPLPGSHVWLVRYADRTRWPIVAHQYAMSVRRTREPAPQIGDPLNGFGVVFTVGHLGFWLFGVEVPGPAAVQSDTNDAYIKVWPTFGGDVRWPPARPFSREADLEGLARRMPSGTEIHGPQLNV